MRQALDKISTQLLRVIPFILSLVTPLFFLPITADFFSFNKYFFVAAIGTISLAAWCIRNLTRGKLHFTTSPALLPLIILVLANVVSSIWLSPTKHVSLFGQTSLFFFLAIIFITVTSSQKNHFTINSSIYGLIVSTSLLSLFTLLQHFGVIGRIFSSATLNNRLFNPTGGVFPAISFTLPILIAATYFTIGIKNWTLKSVLFASVLLMIVGTVINISLILPQNGQPTISILPVKAGWSIAVDTLKTWRTALLGTGPETYSTAFTRLRPAYLNLDKNLWSVRFSESSTYLFTLITTTGLIGALAFFFSFLRPLIISLKNRKTTAERNTFNFLLIALALVILSFLVIPTGVVSLVLGIVLLICLTIQLKIENQKSVKDITFSLSADSSASPIYHDLPETVKTSISTSFLPWLVTFLSIAVLVSYWFFAGRTYLASVSFKQASNLIQSNPYGAYLKLQKASELDAFNSYYPQNLSQLYLSVASTNLAKEKPTAEEKKAGTDFAQRAIDAGKVSAQLDSTNVTVWENLFAVYRTLIPYAQGAADLAISHGLQAASVYPTNPAIYLQLGTLFYNLGDADQAIKFIDRANELKQNWDLPYFNLSANYKGKKDYAKALQYANAGLQYTDSNGKDYPTIQEEIKALEELVPSTATPSATPQQ
ncbi:tetratricopeptide repeat protein [bacterium]|nr:MAG: tetratricopeptide repeat protein [bacterium]